MTVVRVHHFGIDPAQFNEFLRRRQRVIDAIQPDHPGLEKATLLLLDDGTHHDVWWWHSPEAMAFALEAAANIPEIGPAMSLTINASSVDGELVDER